MLTALSPLDGRYANKTQALGPIASEFGLQKYRLQVELQWLIALSDEPGITEIPTLSPEAVTFCANLIKQFSPKDGEAIKAIEATTNHDVKALEYWIKEKFQTVPELATIQEFVHFACTSEDINNLAYALMCRDLRDKVLLPELNTLMETLRTLSNDNAHCAMLSHTHGQAASPTTVGKEFANVLARLQRQVSQWKDLDILGKINGAVGNFNAHAVAYPEVDWPTLSKNFVADLGLAHNPMTTQIEPHDNLAEYCHNLIRTNSILIDFCRDVWGYIALGYFSQKPVAGEVGSSTMPHKINPIDFENAEGNAGLGNAILGHLAEKCPLSRWQRDLTDSTVLRNIGIAVGYTDLACQSLKKGLSKLAVNEAVIAADLDANWEVLGEAIQTVMRRYGIENPYEKLKALTRGKKLTQADLKTFIQDLSLPDPVKKQLLALTPASYTGLADQLTREATQS